MSDIQNTAAATTSSTTVEGQEFLLPLTKEAKNFLWEVLRSVAPRLTVLGRAYWLDRKTKADAEAAIHYLQTLCRDVIQAEGEIRLGEARERAKKARVPLAEETAQMEAFASLLRFDEEVAKIQEAHAKRQRPKEEAALAS